ncbi:MAG: FeoB-associated Cys-rich membrane protein [Eubacterium sp.]
MNFATFIIGAFVFIPMALIIYKQIKKAKNGETGCGCGCSGCPQASKCHSVSENSQKIEQASKR